MASLVFRKRVRKSGEVCNSEQTIRKCSQIMLPIRGRLTLQVSVEFLFPRWLRLPLQAWIQPLGCVFAELARVLRKVPGGKSHANPACLQDFNRPSADRSSHQLRG
jgi:hypothetical protein